MKTSSLIRAIIGFTLYLGLVPAILFLAAGTLNWPEAWVFVALLLISTIISRVIIWVRNPDLLRERANFTRSEGVPEKDRMLVLISVFLGPVVLMVTAGLDHRYQWSPQLATGWQICAGMLMLLGYALAVWAMIVNPYFSAVVRIQEDRGQVVVSEAPYAFVRHPAYSGSLLSNLMYPILFNSLWAWLPSLLLVILLISRTKLEDELLQSELADYPEYCTKTRYRLVPGIW